MTTLAEAGPTVLGRIDGPADLRLLDDAEITKLAADLRRSLIATVCSTGGHLGSNLGVVELTIALHRVFDQVLMDVALHRLPVTFVLERAGVTGDDGQSHNGVWDLSLLGMVPGLRVAAPRDAVQLGLLLREAVAADGPTVVRFPKAAIGAPVTALETDQGVDILARGSNVLIVSVGAMAGMCLATADRLGAVGVTATVVDPRWVRPVNPVIARLAADHSLVVTVEDGVQAGGTGNAVAQTLADHGMPAPPLNLALPQEFLAHGRRPDVLRARGLATDSLAGTVLDRLSPWSSRAVQSRRAS